MIGIGAGKNLMSLKANGRRMFLAGIVNIMEFSCLGILIKRSI